jgi:hypothetical protein
MKITNKTSQVIKPFDPITIEFVIESEEEFQMFLTISKLNITIPNTFEHSIQKKVISFLSAIEAALTSSEQKEAISFLNNVRDTLFSLTPPTPIQLKNRPDFNEGSCGALI